MSLCATTFRRAWLGLGIALAFLVIGSAGTGGAVAAQTTYLLPPQADWRHGHHLVVTSATFTSGSTLPQSTILNAEASFGPPPVPGCEGKDRSPQLSWYGAPHDTKSFAVIMFDIDASFTHWGMYNISGDRHNLPDNAGVKGSAYGMQVANDYGLGQEYDGPCPPPGQLHHYVITVYALDVSLNLSKPYGFVATGESLLAALLDLRSHILDSGSILGTYFIIAPPK